MSATAPGANPSRLISEKRAAFRKIHEAGCFVLPNPYDVGSAMALQHMGFKAIASTSAGFAWSIGKADNRVTIEDVLQHLNALCGAVATYNASAPVPGPGNLFADKLTLTEIGGKSFPAPFLQSLTPMFVILLTPLFSMLWISLKDRQPSSPVKFTLGLLFIGTAYLLMIPAAMLTAQGRVSFWWLVGLYFLEVCGEMCLSPVGLSTVTKLAPARLVGLMMGAWFLATSLGNKLAGYLSGFFVANDSWQLTKLYGGIAFGLLASAIILALLTPTIKKLIGVRA